MFQGLPFQFNVPVTFFEKAAAPVGQRRRIAGLISTESRDRQDEIILQRGLDFTDFETFGWYNDNHSRDTTGIVGYPDGPVKFIRKGEKLPNGIACPADGHWAEGYLLEGHAPADKIWNLGQSLQKSGRRLGFSIEGAVQKRSGKDKKIVAKAKVRNVAITAVPVNTDTCMEVIAKSLRVVEQTQDPILELLNKALTMGPATPGQAPTGPATGEGAGPILTPESLESGAKDQSYGKKKKKKKKKLTKSEALAFVEMRYPGISRASALRIINYALRSALGTQETP